MVGDHPKVGAGEKRQESKIRIVTGMPPIHHSWAAEELQTLSQPADVMGVCGRVLGTLNSHEVTLPFCLWSPMFSSRTVPLYLFRLLLPQPDLSPYSDSLGSGSTLSTGTRVAEGHTVQMAVVLICACILQGGRLF